MSAFSGRQGRGAMRLRKAEKRAEAEQRNALTKPDRTRAYRLAVQHLEELGKGLAA